MIFKSIEHTTEEALDFFANGKDVTGMNLFSLNGFKPEEVKDNSFELMK